MREPIKHIEHDTTARGCLRSASSQRGGENHRQRIEAHRRGIRLISRAWSRLWSEIIIIPPYRFVEYLIYFTLLILFAGGASYLANIIN